ncbi:MAG: outer membrane beta-barrel protein [Verrucomicrobiota bacterium]
MVSAVPGTSALDIELTEQPISPMRDYNIRIFDNLWLSFTGSMEVMYDDNVDTSETDEIDSFALIPRLGLAVDWPISPRVHLGTGALIGYRYYFNDDVDDDVLVGFDDDLSTNVKIDFFLGNGILRLEERFSRELGVLEVDTDNDYALSRNRVSMKYDVPVNKYMDLTVQGSRRDTWNNDDTYSYQENVRHALDGVLLWQANRQLRIGPYLRWDTTDYDDANNNDRDTYSSGASFVYRRQDGIRFTGSLGYEIMDVDGAGAEKDGVVGNVGVNFSTSDYLTHYLRFAFDRSQDLVETDVNYSEETRYSYGVEWQALKAITINGDVAFLDIDDSGNNGEEVDMWQLGLGTTYQLNRRSKVSLRYDWRDRDSNRPDNSYDRNRYSIKLSHRF